jgi:anti-sigma regulatory factor (Ser/Thr protein kinase)
MAPDTSPATLTLASDLAQLPVARRFVERFCEAGGLDACVTRAIVLATNEAISNVIRHAHGHLSDARLQIECRLHPDRLEIQIRDEGKPFDVTAVPHLDPGEVRIGGRGVFLMRTLMDEISCKPLGASGNLLRMVKHLNK